MLQPHSCRTVRPVFFSPTNSAGAKLRPPPPPPMGSRGFGCPAPRPRCHRRPPASWGAGQAAGQRRREPRAYPRRHAITPHRHGPTRDRNDRQLRFAHVLDPLLASGAVHAPRGTLPVPGNRRGHMPRAARIHRSRPPLRAALPPARRHTRRPRLPRRRERLPRGDGQIPGDVASQPLTFPSECESVYAVRGEHIAELETSGGIPNLK
jgi:hypothetical protein